MGKVAWVICLTGMLVLASFGASSKIKPEGDGNSIVIFFKDGHQQSFPVADIARIEFSSPATTASASWPAHFAGRWKVGDGMGGTFIITLQRNGQAKKTIGSNHGTWTTVNGEARISWDDGWHDAIRKAGDGYEKAAFEPGKSFDDGPSNTADAKNMDPI